MLGTCSRGNFEMIDTIWLDLMYHFDQIKSFKSTIIYYKNNYYSYTSAWLHSCYRRRSSRN